MSDFFNNENETNQEQNNTPGEYAYSGSDINQGESYYQWSPYEASKKKPKKVKKPTGFAGKLGRAAAIALVFGLVAGIAFQSVVLVSNKYITGNDTAATESTASSTASDSTTSDATSTSLNTSGTVATTTSTATTISDVSDIVDSVMPAIVQVTNVGVTEYQTFFGQTYEQESTSCGSGIIISQDSDYIYIATNNHVVSGAETLTITFVDDSYAEGQIKGTDSSCDLAVVAVALSDLSSDTISSIKVATIGDSDVASVGESCVVIGNALGYGQSVTTGVISAKDRQVEITDDDGNVITNSLIQTDAAVNPGNSGGALLNMNGEVIGIVSAKLSSDEVEGMGYAIPINYASSIIEQMIDSDVVSDLEASYIGIAGVDITSSMASQYNMPQGVYVSQVVSGSGAEAAGIQKGDIITSINGRTVTSMSTIQNILQYISAGTTIEVEVSTAESEYAETATYEVTVTNKNSVMQ